MTTYRYLFGPVLSRRLGRSLGVDCVPAKTCNLDCIYCECGPTDALTMQRKEYVPLTQLKQELTDYLTHDPVIDVITLTGSGEPLLYSRIGELIAFIRATFGQYKIALITNGTLLSDPLVRQQILDVDVVLPNLDAVSRARFQSVNKPHPDLDPARITAGLIDFAHEFKGALWLEVFIVPGVNDSWDEIAAIKTAALQIGPSRVQLNSLDRPCADGSVKPASPERLEEIARALRPLPVEIIARSYKNSDVSSINPADMQTILATVERRPLTAEDISALTGVSLNNAFVIMNNLTVKKMAGIKMLGGKEYLVKSA